MKVWAIMSKDGKYPMVFGHDSYSAWRRFFEPLGTRGPQAEAQEAYEAIGYKAQEFEIVAIPSPPQEEK